MAITPISGMLRKHVSGYFTPFIKPTLLTNDAAVFEKIISFLPTSPLEPEEESWPATLGGKSSTEAERKEREQKKKQC